MPNYIRFFAFFQLTLGAVDACGAGFQLGEHSANAIGRALAGYGVVGDDASAVFILNYFPAVLLALLYSWFFAFVTLSLGFIGAYAAGFQLGGAQHRPRGQGARSTIQKRLRVAIGKLTKNGFFAALVFTFPGQSHGAGFAVFTHGADALGEGLATTAHGSTPEVLFYNPALINRLDGTQIENGVTFIAPMRDFHSNRVNITAETEGEVFFPPTLYLTHKYSDKVSLGVGIFSPFGLSTEWGAGWEGRYITTRAELRTLNFNPVASFQLTPSTSFAAGPDFLLVDATLENKLNFSALGLPDGNQKFSGNGFGVGFNLGIHSEMTQNIAFGVSYRSEIEVDIDGDAEFDLPSPVLSPAFPNTDGRTDITFPQQLHAAIAYSGIDRLTLEVGVRWEGWSSFDELRIELEQPVNGVTTSVSPRDWHDTLTLTTGGRYQLNDRIALLAGFVWGEDPIPDETFDPIVTDSNHYAVTFGTEIGIRKHRLSLAYSFQKWDDRVKNNDVGAAFSGGAVPDARANGEYEASSHFLALSFTYVF